MCDLKCFVFYLVCISVAKLLLFLCSSKLSLRVKQIGGAHIHCLPTGNVILPVCHRIFTHTEKQSDYSVDKSISSFASVFRLSGASDGGQQSKLVAEGCKDGATMELKGRIITATDLVKEMRNESGCDCIKT